VGLAKYFADRASRKLAFDTEMQGPMLVFVSGLSGHSREYPSADPFLHARAILE
jgi:hypothetical protein